MECKIQDMAWCLEVCMLTPEMGKYCERVVPCPLGYQDKEDIKDGNL